MSTYYIDSFSTLLVHFSIFLDGYFVSPYTPGFVGIHILGWVVEGAAPFQSL